MYKLPVGEVIDTAVEWIMDTFGGALDTFAEVVDTGIDLLYSGLEFLPWWITILIVVALSFKLSGWRLALGSALGLLLIYNLRLWPSFLDTLVLVIISALISIIIGIPLGILAGRSDKFHTVITPILDFMQTMPSFVYLIPALMFFGLGKVPATFATVIFAMPPAIRLTDLGIRQVPEDLVEVGEAFGSTPSQMLYKIQLPVALPTIMAGLNQTMMLSLSMVVIAAMIGAGGFGAGVLAAIAQIEIGMGFENGVSVVIMAIILDRLTQGIGRSFRTDDK